MKPFTKTIKNSFRFVLFTMKVWLVEYCSYGGEVEKHIFRHEESAYKLEFGVYSAFFRKTLEKEDDDEIEPSHRTDALEKIAAVCAAEDTWKSRCKMLFDIVVDGYRIWSLSLTFINMSPAVEITEMTIEEHF